MTETNAQEIMRRLAEPFAGPVVKWRVQGKPIERNGKYYGRAVCYVDARIVIDRLNEVLGFDWETQTIETGKGRTLCRLGITINGVTRWRDDGAGDTDIEGEKGSISDALKRAAVRFGIGAYLYALPSPRVEVDAREKDGRVYVNGIKDHDRDRLADLAQRSLDQWTAALEAIDAQADEGEPPRKQESDTEQPRKDKYAPAHTEEETDAIQAAHGARAARGKAKPKSDAAVEDRKDKLKKFVDRAVAAIEGAETEGAIADILDKATASKTWPVLVEEWKFGVGEINKAAIKRRAALAAGGDDFPGDKPGPKPAKREPAGKDGIRRLPPPTVNDAAGWRTWGQNFAAAIKAAPHYEGAIALIEAHKNCLEILSSFAERDSEEWARGIADKHHANRKQETGGRAR